MFYRGYDLLPYCDRSRVGDKYVSRSVWGVFQNGELVISVDTLKVAKERVEELTKGTLYRPRKHRAYKQTEFDEYKKVMEDTKHD